MLYALLWLFNLPTGSVEGSFFTNYGSWPAYNLQVQGDLLTICNPKQFYVMDLEGRLMHRVSVPVTGGQFNTSGNVLFDGVLYADVFDGSIRLLIAVDIHTGQLIEERRVTYRNLFILDGRLHGVGGKDRFYSAIIHQLDPRSLEISGSFFKKPMFFDRTREPICLWVAEAKDYKLVCTETSNRLHITHHTTLQIEKKTSNYTPGYYPYADLEAPGFINPEPLPVQTPKVMDTASKTIYINLRLASTGRTVYFGGHERGFVYCYTVPDYIDGICVGNHLAVQFYDRRFRPLGEPLHRFGQVAGLMAGDLVIFYPDGPEPPPDDEGIRSHYGTETIRGADHLRALLTQFRARKQRVLEPIIELIPAP
ncbi:MAG: hypothetical protein QNK37_19375 [Acidobacteriota bacterium]|nr:hypothetical protein [Acidobacteriota bacterium]